MWEQWSLAGKRWKYLQRQEVLWQSEQKRKLVCLLRDKNEYDLLEYLRESMSDQGFPDDVMEILLTGVDQYKLDKEPLLRGLSSARTNQHFQPTVGQTHNKDDVTQEVPAQILDEDTSSIATAQSIDEYADDELVALMLEVHEQITIKGGTSDKLRAIKDPKVAERLGRTTWGAFRDGKFYLHGALEAIEYRNRLLNEPPFKLYLKRGEMPHIGQLPSLTAYYVVYDGWQRGVFSQNSDAQAATQGYLLAKQRKFHSIEHVMKYLATGESPL